MSALLEADEEAMRRQVEALHDADRERFYSLSAAAFKDPDLYATLAYLFVSGLHHFYLEKWGRGLIDLGLNVVGVAAIIAAAYTDNLPLALGGAAIVLAVAVVELKHLFNSQEIVRRHNLERQGEILAMITGRVLR